ncbi:MAG: aminopeptidase P family protein [Bacteroidales bacterium]|jgi:Xaa-Pro aminopeptidase|nr:aminopeptidase P family protein [Bacteroidales bacterium]
MTIKERIAALRRAMKEAGMAAWIVPGTDPHMNEHLPNYWSERHFISGFTGSAGKVLITQDMAGLWTDGRYFIQAAEQLQEGGLELFKEKVAGTPTMAEYLNVHLSEGDKVGINGLIVAENIAAAFQSGFKGLELITDVDLLGQVWDERPPLSRAPLFTLPESISGESTASKLLRMRAVMGEADAILVNMLDEIAWLYNVRGSDVKCNPVVMSYAWVEKDMAFLFVDETKVSDADRALLEADGINIFPYDAILEMLPELSEGKTVLTDYDKSNHAIVAAMAHAKVLPTASWIALQKAQKNEVELQGTRRAMLKDGVALTQFLMWLEQSLAEKPLTEYEIGLQLNNFRAKQVDYVGESFDTIVGYKSNGAIAHYSAPKEGSLEVKQEGILLMDSGGQYKHGTTDITRTVAVGSVSDGMRRDFTLVLKGHIALGLAKFPQGTRGSQLDVLARMALWNETKDYQHGTGHGVGHFLNVHEGPQSIRKDENMTPLLKGMMLSNEPGYYLEGQYGIRIENLVAVKEDKNDFLSFENLTLCPIDKRVMDATLLSILEKEWLNAYHQDVYNKLSPLLSAEENAWLREKTLPILA